MGADASPAGDTLTLTVPTQTTSVTTVKAPSSGRTGAQGLQAALSDPSKIPSVADPATRRELAVELRDLNVFLAGRPRLQPYREHIWYVAEHVHPPLTPRRLAALLWCTLWRPNDCG